MFSQSISKIEKIAEAVRAAIEQLDVKYLPITMQSFPYGACGDAALLLGTYYKEIGLGSFNYVLGMRGEYEAVHSHAWLKQGNVLVDITADQFPEVRQKVIVTEHSAWHSTFEIEYEHEADFFNYDARTAVMLGGVYSSMKKGLPHR
jgi:hypothetical protein